MYTAFITRSMEMLNFKYHIQNNKNSESSDNKECCVWSERKVDSFVYRAKPFVRQKCIRRKKNLNNRRSKLSSDLEKCAILTIDILHQEIQRKNRGNTMIRKAKITKVPAKKVNQIVSWFKRLNNRRLEPKASINFRLISNYLHKRNMHLLNQKAFINGEWDVAANLKTFEIRNPANGEVIGTLPDMDVTDVEKAINAASEAFKSWQLTTAKERSNLLRKWYDLLNVNKESIAKIMTAESGKPLIESNGEVAYGNSFVEWFSEEARRINGEIIPSPVQTKKILIEKQPIGVVGLITPWNFPHAMITRKAGAALAAGCTCVIKPAEDTPFTALTLAHLAQEAGIPKGVINVVTCDRGNTPAIGKLLCEHPNIAGISFTGSTQVGKILYQQCAKHVKRVALELGGNAPFIVFNSANIDKAVQGAMASKFRNCGQTCVSANRFLVHEDVYDSFVQKLSTAMQFIKLGNGFEDGVTAGPLINTMQMNKVSDIVEDAVKKGAKVILGGKAAKKLGELFYEPTLLTNIKENMDIYKEEIFGPVAPIYKFKTEEEALKIANNTNRGLAGYFYSEDVSQIFRVGKLLEVGIVGINEGIVSTTEAPFGGVKESGIGREGSHHGIDEYTYIKYLCLGNL